MSTDPRVGANVADFIAVTTGDGAPPAPRGDVVPAIAAVLAAHRPRFSFRGQSVVAGCRACGDLETVPPAQPDGTWRETLNVARERAMLHVAHEVLRASYRAGGALFVPWEIDGAGVEYAVTYSGGKPPTDPASDYINYFASAEEARNEVAGPSYDGRAAWQRYAARGAWQPLPAEDPVVQT